MRVTFILPGRGGGGGAHSVVQEAGGLQRLGVEVAIATTADTYADFRMNYPDLAGGVRTPAFRDDAELGRLLTETDLAVATTAPSANQLAAVLGTMEGARPRAAYYVQDYEPLFFTPGTPQWSAARDSYTALPDPLLFAKTEWLCAMVQRNHGRAPVKVQASIDHDTYRPDLSVERTAVTVSAMIRPRTLRRAPRRHVRVLERLAAAHGERIRLVSFGCEAAELEADGLRLSRTVNHRGVLSRRQVAAVLRDSDLFLDLSDYQAFGRTGLEGMACGCVPVLPVFGGADEYARHGENAFVVDTRSDEAIMAAATSFIDSAPAAREGMRMAALSTALDYSVERAAFSEYQAFRRFLS